MTDDIYMADAHTPIGQIYQRAVDAGASFISIEAACGHREIIAMSAGADRVKLMLARVSMLPCANCQVAHQLYLLLAKIDDFEPFGHSIHDRDTYLGNVFYDLDEVEAQLREEAERLADNG